MIPDDMKDDYVPWDKPVNANPLADMKRAIKICREHSVPIDSPEACPQAYVPSRWQRMLAKLWPEDGNRPRLMFERDYGNHSLMFTLFIGRNSYVGCYAFGRGLRLAFDHHRNCDCDDCLPF